MATTTTTRYCYDAFGRRIAKSSSVKKSSKLGLKGNVPRFGFVSYEKPQRHTLLMLWDGNRQIQEYTTDHVFTTVYEQDSFVPVARIVQLSEVLEKQRIAEKILYVEQHVPYGIVNQEFYDNIKKAKEPLVKIYYYHCNHLGTPQELSDEKGDIIWLSYDRAWGGNFDTLYKQQFVDNFAISENELQPFKFQGQTLDIETGLHYNRFRYYDSDVGMFVQRDPIGLLGGDNVFSYAPNPVEWIDPLGLNKTPAKDCCKDRCRGRTEPVLPAGTIVNSGSIKIEHYYKPDDHPPAHMHVVGGGGKTRIGANGKPLKGDPELTKAQKKVVEDNLPTIRSAGKKIGKWLDYKEECG